MTHVDSRSRRRERKHVTRVDAIDNLRNSLSHNHIAWIIVEASLHRPNCAIHAIVGERRITASMLGHETQWSCVIQAA